MSNYRRAIVPGGVFFFTVVTCNRRPIFKYADPVLSGGVICGIIIKIYMFLYMFLNIMTVCFLQWFPKFFNGSTGYRGHSRWRMTRKTDQAMYWKKCLPEFPDLMI